MKRFASLLIVVVFVVSTLTGCDSKTETKLDNTNLIKSPTVKEYTTNGKQAAVFEVDPSVTGEIVVRVLGNTFRDEHTNPPILLAEEAFKKYYPNVNLVFNTVDFNKQEDYDNYFKIISTEVMAGKGPDLFYISDTGSSDLNKMVQAGAFADMYDFFENDKTFNINDYQKESFYSGQWKGKQYLIPADFDMPMLLTTKKTVEKYDINISAMTDYYTTYDELDRVVKKATDLAEPIRGATFINNALWHSKVTWIDKENKLVSINGNKELFNVYDKAFNTLGKSMPTNITCPISGGSYDTLATEIGDAIIGSENLFADVTHDLGAIAKVGTRAILEGQDPILVPIRNIDGGVTAGTNYVWAVRNNSSNKENAYRFLRLMLSEEYNGFKGVNACGEKSPINLKALDNYIQSILDYKMYNINNKAKAEEFKETYLGYVSDIDSSVFYASRPIRMLKEELYRHWTEEKSYEECAKIAEDKLMIYLSE